MRMITEKEDYKNTVEMVRDYRTLFGSELGQRILWDLAKNCHFLSPTFQSDPAKSAHREGERNVLLRILHILDQDPARLEERSKNQGVDDE